MFSIDVPTIVFDYSWMIVPQLFSLLATPLGDIYESFKKFIDFAGYPWINVNYSESVHLQPPLSRVVGMDVVLGVSLYFYFRL
jgi:hypothetical protein